MTEPSVTAGLVPEWTLGWRLQRSLSHAGISVEEMANELGVVRATLSRWMHDRGAPPRAAYVKQWALRTGVPYKWLNEGQWVEPDGPSPVSSGKDEDKRCFYSDADQDTETLADVLDFKPRLWTRYTDHGTSVALTGS